MFGGVLGASWGVLGCLGVVLGGLGGVLAVLERLGPVLGAGGKAEIGALELRSIYFLRDY